ncbi:outer membrane protein assembly factor [Pseudidiomarina aquimaris]|uniref:Translocation and assembly module subunit TamA n=1 Tax=Pseudidiomarina aquimaris TaxID=641841 RepID=A0A432XB52_9GAMM|nr:autotransporter assembly complex family protein [Pseudidiomarina aquimaris]RUO45880.1 outer membrane protein assembly factor [Pseudidiomarina aquimaris]
MIARKGLCLLVLLFGCLLPNSANAQQEQAEAILQVSYTGVEGELADNVESYLGILEYAGEPALSIFRVRFLARRGEAEIKQALRPFGYYHTEVTSEISSTREQVAVNYTINLGQRTRISAVNLNIEGGLKDDDALQVLRQSIPVKVGAPLLHTDYERTKTMLRNLAAERGYYDAQFTEQKLQIELSEAAAIVHLTYASGERFRFGDVSICCNHLSSSFIERYFQFSKGDYFHTRDLLDLQVALAGSDYFETVEVAPLWQEATDQTVPVSIRVTPNQRDFYQVGPGYGTDTGARLTLGFDRRWVNDRGHRLSSLLRLSQIQSTGFVDYIIPGKNPARDQYSITGEVIDRSYEDLDSTLYRTSVRDTRHYNRWQRTYQVSYQQEDFRFGTEPRETSRFLVPSAEFSYVSSNLDPRNRNLVDSGYRVSARLEGASDSLLSSATFVSLTLSGKTVYSLTDKWRVLARAEVGAMETDDFAEISPSLRFFAGGDHSVRGYAYQQLGPTNDEGVVVGGRYLAVASAEVDYLVAPNWRVALFTDMGNSGMEWSMSWKQTYGLGVRWLSPIGPVRLDVAQAIDEPDKPWRLHLTIGPDL